MLGAEIREAPVARREDAEFLAFGEVGPVGEDELDMAGEFAFRHRTFDLCERVRGGGDEQHADGERRS